MAKNAPAIESNDVRIPDRFTHAAGETIDPNSRVFNGKLYARWQPMIHWVIDCAQIRNIILPNCSNPPACKIIMFEARTLDSILHLQAFATILCFWFFALHVDIILLQDFVSFQMTFSFTDASCSHFSSVVNCESIELGYLPEWFVFLISTPILWKDCQLICLNRYMAAVHNVEQLRNEIHDSTSKF